MTHEEALRELKREVCGRPKSEALLLVIEAAERYVEMRRAAGLTYQRPGEPGKGN